MYRLTRDGHEVDATFSIEMPRTSSIEITLESAGGTSGTTASRNADYPVALELILQRLSTVASRLDDCLISSRIARRLPENQRRVTPSAPFKYPIELDRVEDFGQLRRALTSPQGSVASSRTKPGGGNQRKRISLYFTPRDGSCSLSQLRRALEAVPVDVPRGSRGDIAAGLTRKDVDAAIAHWDEVGRDAFHQEFGTTRAAKYLIIGDNGAEYDAKAILFAARVLKGWTDASNSDFDGDRSSVAEPLEALGLSISELVKAPKVASGPAIPSATVREELNEFLSADDSKLGDVYRGLAEDLTVEQIASSLGIATPNLVRNYLATISALLDGTVPSGPTVALQVARKLRNILKSGGLSSDAVSYIQENLTRLEARADDRAELLEEEEQALRRTEAAERSKSPGVYVYALPHYLRYPFDPTEGRTLFKVGCTENSAVQRFLDQTRTTALPEEPVLLRIYSSSDAREMERRFHGLLTAFDHAKEVERTAGKEWFLTTLGHLDALAAAFELPIEVVTDFGADD